MDVWRYSDWAGYGAGGPRQPAAHLALARLDRRVAQRRQAATTDDRRDARRRRACPDRSRRRSGPPASWSGNWYRFNRNTWLEDDGRAHRQGVPRPDPELRPLPRPQVRPDRARPIITASGPSSSRTMSALTGCPASPTSRRTASPRVFDCHGRTPPTYLFVRGDEQNPDKASRSARACRQLLGGAALKIGPIELPLARCTGLGAISWIQEAVGGPSGNERRQAACGAGGVPPSDPCGGDLSGGAPSGLGCSSARQSPAPMAQRTVDLAEIERRCAEAPVPACAGRAARRGTGGRG